MKTGDESAGRSAGASDVASARPPRTAIGVMLILLLLGVALFGLNTTNNGRGSSVALSMTPAQAASDLTFLPPAECHSHFRDNTAPPECIYGATAADTTIVLVGDSHAQQWLPALDQAGRDRGWAVLSWSKSSCTVIDVPLYNTRLDRGYHECSEWRSAVLQNLTDRGSVDLVLIGDSYGYGGSVLNDEGEVFEDQALLMAAWRAGTIKTVTDYSPVSGGIVLLHDTPWSIRNVPRCLTEDPTTPERCAFSLDGHAWLDEAYVAEELNAGGEFVEAIDMTRFICETDPCSIVSETGIIKYRDGHHLTATFSRSLSGYLGDALEPLLKRPDDSDP